VSGTGRPCPVGIQHQRQPGHIAWQSGSWQIVDTDHLVNGRAHGQRDVRAGHDLRAQR
jgi:hypothetical protein